MNSYQLRNKVINEELDYLMLSQLLSDYASPRDKITLLLNRHVLMRVKKGLYVFGPEFAREAYSKATLANLLYGPSAISMIYALSFYGIVPERVETVTSITPKRNKQFVTPVGQFSYRYLELCSYSVGLTQVNLDKTHNIIIATPEKALADEIILNLPRDTLLTQNEIIDYLFEDLRIDESSFEKFNYIRLAEIALTYQDRRITLLFEFLKEKYLKW